MKKTGLGRVLQLNKILNESSEEELDIDGDGEVEDEDFRLMDEEDHEEPDGDEDEFGEEPLDHDEDAEELLFDDEDEFEDIEELFDTVDDDEDEEEELNEALSGREISRMAKALETATRDDLQDFIEEMYEQADESRAKLIKKLSDEAFKYRMSNEFRENEKETWGKNFG